MKSKKEREGNESMPRIPIAMFITPPKTSVASKLRKDAQAKALAAEVVAATSESESPEDEGDIEEQNTTIKRKRRTEEEEEEDQRITAVYQAERRERAALDKRPQ
jgi:hypothetical protein